jgi:hypothetical protein
MNRATHALFTLIFATTLGPGCRPDKDDTGDSDTRHTGGDTDDTGSPPPPSPPCGDGTWGAISSDPATAIHVRTDGSDDGDGSAENPLATIEAALEISRARSEDKLIAIGPGTFETNLLMATDLGDGTTDDGTVIQGCSAVETILEASASDSPVISVSAAVDVVLEGLCTRGGTRGIQVWSLADVSISSVVVEDSWGVGLVINGNGTTAALTDVEVYSSRPFFDGSNGYGFAFQEGAVVTMDGGGAYENTGVGILVSDVDEVAISGVTIEGTQRNDDGYYGRGIQIQDFAQVVSIEDSVFRDNHDAGVFSLTTLSFSLSNTTVEGTLASDMPALEGESGDGVVVTRGEDNLDPADYTNELADNTVTGSARAGIVLDGVTAVTTTNDLSGNGYEQEGSSFFAQGPAVVSGDDTVATLSDDSALGLNLEPMASVDFSAAP